MSAGTPDLTAEQRATLTALLDRLIPADEHGPGAVEAQVPRAVERSLQEEHAGHRGTYAQGLDDLDARARATHAAGFAALEAAAQDALLGQIEGTAFFELARTHAIEGMFGDPRWGGNAGEAGWKLIGYPGPKKVWTEPEQALEALPMAPPGA